MAHRLLTLLHEVEHALLASLHAEKRGSSPQQVQVRLAAEEYL